MAEINGTNNAVAENLAGSIADDVIFGFGGPDFINGAGGNDIIDGGAGVDDILGGAGDDTIIALAGEIAGDIIDGGDGVDTLVTDLAAGAVINNFGTANASLNGFAISNVNTAFTTENLEFVQVSNASDFLLDLGSDATFGLDISALSTGAAAGVATLGFLDYTATATGGTVAANTSTDLTAGVIIGGVTYATGATFVTADGGTVTVGDNATNFTLSYAPLAIDTYAVGVSGLATDDVLNDSLVATVTLADASTVDVAVDFSIDLGANFDATAAAAGITSKGDFQANTMTGSLFDDVIWAGADSGIDNDTLSGLAGNDTLAGGDGSDVIDGGADDDIIYAGAGNDGTSVTVGIFGGTGDDKIFGGEGNDFLNGDTVASAGTGLTTDGNDTIYGGAGTGTDTIHGNGGDDIIFGGDGIDALYGNDGNDTIYNGAGNDIFVDGGAGDDVLWGGAGNDTLTGGLGNDTFGFISGNGLDIVADWNFGAYTTASDIGDVLDLSAFGFTDAQDVINSMTDLNGGGVQLVLAAGTVVSLNVGTALSVNDFQIEAITDWVLV
jgi:Ca2+-binding RTX toxin-like protein